MSSQAANPTPQLHVAAAHQSQACREKAHMATEALSISPRESPRKGVACLATTNSADSITMSPNKSSSEHANKEIGIHSRGLQEQLPESHTRQGATDDQLVTAESEYKCQTDPNTGLETYRDDFGNVYKSLPLPPWQDAEEPRNRGISKKTSLPSQPIEIPRNGGTPHFHFLYLQVPREVVIATHTKGA